VSDSRKRFSSSGEIFSWLLEFANFERGHSIAKSYRLDRTEILAGLAGNPEKCAPSIHMAGSKGKGSVTAMISSILEAQGLRVARYMSPHVSDSRERVSLGNAFFDDSVYCAAGDELREIVEVKLPASKARLFDPTCAEGEGPTYFELLTLFYFLCARSGRCDALVVETGMGGRLDCTNIVDPLVSVITLIELEHTAWLGNTIAEIAGEKAGIIKPGKPVLVARQRTEALEVFRDRANAKNSSFLYFPEIASIENIRLHTGGTDFTLALSGANNQKLDLSIPTPGAVQAENAGLAVKAVKIAFPEIADGVIARGLAQAKIPARFEKVVDDPPFILDGAHTPESVSLCAQTFCSLYGMGGLLLFSCALDKNVKAMAQMLLPFFSRIIITTPGAFKASAPDEIYKAFCEGGADKTVLVPDVVEAARLALSQSREKGLPALCAGSFYLAAEARAVALKL